MIECVTIDMYGNQCPFRAPVPRNEAGEFLCSSGVELG